MKPGPRPKRSKGTSYVSFEPKERLPGQRAARPQTKVHVAAARWPAPVRYFRPGLPETPDASTDAPLWVIRRRRIPRFSRGLANGGVALLSR